MSKEQSEWRITPIPGGRCRWEYWQSGKKLLASRSTFNTSARCKQEIRLLKKQIRRGEVTIEPELGEDGLWRAVMRRTSGAQTLPPANDGFAN